LLLSAITVNRRSSVHIGRAANELVRGRATFAVGRAAAEDEFAIGCAAEAKFAMLRLLLVLVLEVFRDKSTILKKAPS
jgi:hypothetical protein